MYYLINFCMLFTLTVLIFWPHIHSSPPKLFIRYPLLTKLILGVKFGVIGLLTVWISVPYENGLLINAWIVPLLFCGILGGPLALLFAGAIMVTGRLYLFELYPISVYMMSNFVIVILILATLISFKPIRFHNIHLYLFFSLSEISVALLISSFYTSTSYYGIFYLASFNIITFLAIKSILVKSQYARDKVELSLSLDQKDYLTQLPNNYAIEVMLKHHILHEHRFAFLFIDVDHFKYFNVDYGYLVGDSILKELACMLKEFAVEHDAEVGRLSGEEFCCILQNTEPAIAVYQAELFRQRVENYSFGREHNLELSVTVSIGITNIPENAITLETIFKTANSAVSRVHNERYNYVQHINQYNKG